MTADELFDLCLEQPGAWADEPWEDTVVVKVGKPGKIFAFPGADKASVALKVRPEDREELIAAFPGVVTDAAYLSKRHWVRISLDGFPDDELHDLLVTSHQLVCAGLPKAQRPVQPASGGQTFSG